MVDSGPVGSGAEPVLVDGGPLTFESTVVISDPLPVVVGTLSGAVPAQRTVRSGGVGTLEDPVLPGGEAAEDLRLAGLRSGEAEVGLHAGEGVGREAGPLLDGEADLVLPVDVVRRRGDEPELL